MKVGPREQSRLSLLQVYYGRLLIPLICESTNQLTAEFTFSGLSSHPALQSVKDMPVLQDGPPPGGFPSVRFARRIPSTGPTGFTLFALGTVVMAYGFVKVTYSLRAAVGIHKLFFWQFHGVHLILVCRLGRRTSTGGH